MKEATGEMNMTVVTIIAIGAIVAFFWFMWPKISDTISDQFDTVTSAGSNSTDCTNKGGYWDGSNCVTTTK